MLLRQGLAHCFVKNEDGKLADQFVIEPITANSLECMAVGEGEGGWRGAGRGRAGGGPGGHRLL